MAPPDCADPTGVTVWICTIVLGMLLRKATGQGTAVTFIAVASTVTALLLLGWRASSPNPPDAAGPTEPAPPAFSRYR